MPETITVYITKWSLTKGQIIKTKAELHSDVGMIFSKRWGHVHGEGKNWHRTEESAMQALFAARDKKVQSVERQLEKLKRLKPFVTEFLP